MQRRNDETHNIHSFLFTRKDQNISSGMWCWGDTYMSISVHGLCIQRTTDDAVHAAVLFVATCHSCIISSVSSGRRFTSLHCAYVSALRSSNK